MTALPRLFIGIALVTCAVATLAGTRQASFDIVINLQAYPNGASGAGGTCTSGVISGEAGATVSVVCSGREFVAIGPGPGTPGASLPGRMHRFRLDGQQASHPLTAHLGPNGAVGEVTALRVINLQAMGSTLYVRVDF